MQAQTITTSPVGEYYLQGVMETASGFKLNADNTFEFFFSYGALDRDGSGSWKKEGNNIIFNSLQKPGQEYSLVQSKKQPGDSIAVRISGANEHFRKMVHAIIKTGTKEEQVQANADGIINFKTAVADTITLLFEWCPEKKFVFAVPDKTHNYFEFSFEPSIMDVLFDDFKLQLTAQGFTGAHPMDLTKTFTYKKAKQKTP